MVGVGILRSVLLLSALFMFSCRAMTPQMFRASQLYLDEMNHLRLAATKNDTISAKCNNSLIQLENITNSALQMRYLDALGKPGAGILVGHMTWLGSYGECLNISGAEYCLAGIAPIIKAGNKSLPPNPMNPLLGGFKIGVCVPKECTEADIATGLKDIIKAFGLKSFLHLIPDAMGEAMLADTKTVHCAKKSEFTDGVILTITFCSVILAFCLCGTLIELISGTGQSKAPASHVNKNDGFMPITSNDARAEESESFIVRKNEGESLGTPHYSANDSSPLILVNQNKKSFVMEFFLCFSLIQNTNRILDTKVPASAITSINGMRVLSMFWVVLGHTYIWQIFGGAVENIGLEISVIQRFSFQGILNAQFSVDSFFFLSGLLVAYLSFRHMEKSKGKLNLFQFYFHRFWRLTPAYMFVILFFDQLIGFLGEGPLWYQLQLKQPCGDYWWTNLLYINNFYPKDPMRHMCMGWSWYLANDMQFYVISPILILLAYRFGVKGLIASVGSLLLAGFISTAAIIGYYDFQTGNMLANGANQGRSQDYVYIKPYCRISPYLVGIALGYVFHVIKDNVSRPPRWWILLIGWCVAIFLALAPVYGPYKTIRKEDPVPFTKAENIMYGTFSRFSWGLALAWVVYACHIGCGGLVNKILSARFWIPLSRLTYCVYLVHPIVLSAYFGSTQTTMYYSDVNISWHFIAATAVSYVVGFMVSVTFELPMMQLEKIIFKTHRTH